MNKSDYLDWEYAVSVWTDLDTGEQFDNEWDRVMPAYEAHKDLISGTREAVLEKLADHPQGDLIRRGHDLSLVYDVWKDAYRSILPPFARIDPFNQFTSGMNCYGVERRNIFTHRCDDMPDWRTETDVERYNAMLAEAGR